jgi:hypothetical protein
MQASRRARFKQMKSLRDRLEDFAEQAKQKIALLPPGPERDALQEKVRRAETARYAEDWANGSGLRDTE